MENREKFKTQMTVICVDKEHIKTFNSSQILSRCLSECLHKCVWMSVCVSVCLRFCVCVCVGVFKDNAPSWKRPLVPCTGTAPLRSSANTACSMQCDSR